ncbi:MAG TPA: hypothetical protein VFH43_12055, partial [Candidatus Kapabacteria bacterium]|nr:hypothetical protein [Candidatus Kapabacteria bacterium]
MLVLLGLSAILPTSARSQRLNFYVVEQFDTALTWDATLPNTLLGSSDNATYSTTIPFKFSFDGLEAAAGSTVRVGSNGWVQLTVPGFSPNGSTTTFNLLN